MSVAWHAREQGKCCQLLLVLIITLLLDSSLLCSWELSGDENCNEYGYSSWGVKAGCPNPMACLSAQVSRSVPRQGCAWGWPVLCRRGSPLGRTEWDHGHHSQGQCQAVPTWPLEETQGQRDTVQTLAEWHQDGLCYSNSSFCLTYSCIY